MPGALAIPNVFLGNSPDAISKLDTNLATIASYINIRELTFGLLANRPAAGNAGAWYFATDNLTLYGDTGGAWTTVVGTPPLGETLTGLPLIYLSATQLTILGGAASSDDAVIANRVLMTAANFSDARTSATWVVGDAQGKLDTGAVGNNPYHVFVIKRMDTGVVDVLFSLSPTAPTLPANYTKQRRIGSFLVAAGAILPFDAFGDEVWLRTPLIEVANTAIVATTAVTITLTGVPTGVIYQAILNLELSVAAGSQNALLLSALVSADVAATLSTTAPLATLLGDATGIGAVIVSGAQARAWTNTASQIRARAFLASGNWSLATLGWVDRRGRG